jgi:predicted lipoprotein with Yx(FWY)xxD motif
VLGVSSRLILACLLVTGALALAACGGGGEGDTPVASATVSTKKVPGYGTVLATKDGKLLFTLTSDPKGGSKCTDACVEQWPPLSEKGEPTAAKGVKTDMLGTFDRSDGTKQVLYNDLALYTYTGEALAGPGTKTLGGTWYFVSPDGKPVKSTQAGGY